MITAFILSLVGMAIVGLVMLTVGAAAKGFGGRREPQRRPPSSTSGTHPGDMTGPEPSWMFASVLSSSASSGAASPSASTHGTAGDSGGFSSGSGSSGDWGGDSGGAGGGGGD